VRDGQLALGLHAEVFPDVGAGHLDGGGPRQLDSGGTGRVDG